jgi:tetratricopeptide (TPR) repeat protein
MSSETTPNPAPEHTQPSETGPSESPGLWRRLRWFILGFILIVLLAAGAGYLAGQRQRVQAQASQVESQAKEQFDRGVQDLAAGNYELARQRFEYVAEIDPNYPGLAGKLAEIMLAVNQPTPKPTVEATATPNLAPVEDLFSQSQAALRAEDWSLAIDTLLILRSKDAGYRAVEVDGMMYTALRNRGVERIANQGMLEEGMYDLARAQSFGPLDRDASNWRSWAELYLKANSYMGLNWAQAVSHFAQVYLVAPYLRNDAYIKYAVSAQNYADQLVAAGDPCAAEDVYDESLLAWDNATMYPTATEARNLCRTATAPAPKPPETATPGGDTPTPGATATPTPTDTGGGSGDGGGG